MTVGVDLLLSMLKRVRAEGNGFRASCPVPGHGKGRGDVDPSLSVSTGNGAKALIHCHAGCEPDAVLSAIGLTWAEVLPPQVPTQTPEKRIVATYGYSDEAGKLLYQSVRYEPKDFRQRRPDPKRSGEWLWDLKGSRRVLYRLPEILAAKRAGKTIYIVEGEKDVHALVELGLDAATNAGGAGKWRGEYSETLRAANVVIIPDKDEAGRKHGEKVASSLVAVAAGVRVLTLPGPGKDVSDWIIAGGTREELERMATADPTSADVEEPVPIFTRCAADIVPVPVEWIWKNRLARGKLTMLASDPGLGKSLITIAITATISSAGRWPAGEGDCEQGEVLLVTYEDDLADTVVPRLQAAGADLSRVHFLEKVPDDQGPRHFDAARDSERLDKLLQMRPEVRLLIVDPISASMSGVDSHKNNEVRAALYPLVDVAGRHGVAVLAVSHFSKGSGGKALHKVIGSIAFTAAARIAYIAARDDQDPTGDRHLFLPIKSNIGDDRIGLAYRKGGIVLPSGIEAWRIEWGERVTTRADEVMAAMEEDGGAMGEAKAFLQSTLEAGPVAVERVKELAKKAGVAEITLRRAKGKLRVTAQDRDDNGVRGLWTWRLPTANPTGRTWEAL